MPIDYSEYPDNWHEISLRIRTERAGNRCETCGVENGRLIRRDKSNGAVWEYCTPEQSDQPEARWRRPVTVVLTVAHIGAPLADGSPGDKHDKHDVREENLKALCQRCHLVLDLKDHQTNRRNGRNWRKGQQRLNIP